MHFGREDMKHMLYLKLPLHRVGECNSCVGIYKQAWCCSDCSALYFTTGVMDDDMCEFLKAKGINIGEDKRAHFTVRQTCPHYIWETRKCGIYATRPKICKQFPVHFVQMYEIHEHPDGRIEHVKTCSYDWDLDTNQSIDIDLFKMAELLKIE